MKTTNLIFLFLLYCSSALSSVSIKITAPKEVGVDESFTISYEIGTTDISNFQAPDFGNLTLLDNSRSSSSSTTIINGKQTSESSTTFRFLLKADRTGSYTISPATFIIGGTIHKSRSISIKVVQSSHNINGSSQSSQSGTVSPYPGGSDPNSIRGDLFMKAIVSKNTVYEQEAILLTYKIYANTSVSGFHGKLPVLDGFHIQELDIPENQSEEMVNGRPYITAIWKQYILYPQSPGNYTIPSIDCEADILVNRRQANPFGMIFSIPERTTKKIQTTPIKITVNQLPSPPSNFSGAVGTFNVSSSINKRQFNGGDVISLKLNVRGVGNMKLFDTPPYTFPDEFESYDSKVSEKYNVTESGHEGTKTFEYMAVPRKKGRYTLSPIRFTYFDPTQKTYKTLETPQYKIVVNNDILDVNSDSGSDELNKDINHIKTGEITLINTSSSSLFSWKWILSYFLLLLLFIILYLNRKHLFKTLPSSPDEKRKQKIKESIKKIVESKNLISNPTTLMFYDEILNNLNIFMQNKLELDTEAFTKSNIKELLTKNSVPLSTIENYFYIIDECESSRFSPQSSISTNSDIYKRTVEVITIIDSTIK